MRHRLEQVEIPSEHEASERAWLVVRNAFAEREPRPRPARRGAALAAVIGAAAAGLVVVAVSPAGPALVRSVRQAVGLKHAEPVLVELPAAGRLLVDSRAGSWIVGADGSKRLLGPFLESSWSPHGLFEVAARGHELAALDPKGAVRWTLERRGPVHDPRWSPDGYRIAYLAGRSLRVVAGDGTGDRLVAVHVAPVAPAWRAGAEHELAYVTSSGVVTTVDADTGALLARWRLPARPSELLWSPDGKELLSVGRASLELRTASLGRIRSIALRGGTVAAAAWAPRTNRFALVGYDRRRDRTFVTVQPSRGRGAHTVFVGSGRIDAVSWSPDGRWLVLAWRSADQWLFARTTGPARLRAVASIAAQFHSATFPRLGVWCC